MPRAESTRTVVKTPPTKVYHVDEILDSQRRGGSWKFLVKWIGYDESEATWEPSGNIKAEIIKAYKDYTNIDPKTGRNMEKTQAQEPKAQKDSATPSTGRGQPKKAEPKIKQIEKDATATKTPKDLAQGGWRRFRKQGQTSEPPKPKETPVTTEQKKPVYYSKPVSPESELQEEEAMPQQQEEETYFVEKILEVKKGKGGKLYRVKWMNYPHSQSTWEPRKNINPKIIEDFESGKRPSAASASAGTSKDKRAGAKKQYTKVKAEAVFDFAPVTKTTRPKAGPATVPKPVEKTPIKKKPVDLPSDNLTLLNGSDVAALDINTIKVVLAEKQGDVILYAVQVPGEEGYYVARGGDCTPIISAIVKYFEKFLPEGKHVLDVDSTAPDGNPKGPRQSSPIIEVSDRDRKSKINMGKRGLTRLIPLDVNAGQPKPKRVRK